MAMRLTTAQDPWFLPLRALDTLRRLTDHTPTPAPTRTAVWMGRFSQAGWLGGARQPSHQGPSRCGVDSHNTAPAPAARLTVRSHVNGLRISGRVQDVCAELDRLALLETAQSMRTVRH